MASLSKQAGIKTMINIITGFPFETESDFEDTLALIRKLDVITNVNTFTPYPGSPLYAECRQRGLINGGVDWRTVGQHSPYNAFVSEVSIPLYKRYLDEMVSLADEILIRELKRTAT